MLVILYRPQCVNTEIVSFHLTMKIFYVNSPFCHLTHYMVVSPHKDPVIRKACAHVVTSSWKYSISILSKFRCFQQNKMCLKCRLHFFSMFYCLPKFTFYRMCQVCHGSDIYFENLMYCFILKYFVNKCQVTMLLCLYMLSYYSFCDIFIRIIAIWYLPTYHLDKISNWSSCFCGTLQFIPWYLHYGSIYDTNSTYLQVIILT